MYAAELDVSVPVDAPEDRVWATLTRWQDQGRWMLATRVDRIGPEAEGDAPTSSNDGIGTQLEARTGLGPIGFTDTMVITAWDPPRRCDVVHVGGVLRGDGGFTVDALAADRCLLRWWERIRLPGPAGVARLGWRLGRPLVVTGLQRSLRALAAWVEQSESGSAGTGSLAGPERSVGSQRGVGAEQSTGPERPVGPEWPAGPERPAGSERPAGPEQSTGTRRTERG